MLQEARVSGPPIRNESTRLSDLIWVEFHGFARGCSITS